MPIPNPILDDRSYQQLRDELVRRIPVYTPEWTDHNASDPGITLIELFAFLGENLLFRFNQIPETARLEFLRLLQIPMRPATPGQSARHADDRQAERRAGPLGSELKAGSLSFETKTEVKAWPVSFLAVGRVHTPAPDPETEPEVHEFAVRAIDAIGPLLADQTPVYYQNQIVDLKNPPVDFGATVDSQAVGGGAQRERRGPCGARRRAAQPGFRARSTLLFDRPSQRLSRRRLDDTDARCRMESFDRQGPGRQTRIS